MEYTLSGAAKATGSSKSLIHRMCEDGRLSHRKLSNGQYRIDASELGRVFSEKNRVTVPEPLVADEELAGDVGGTEVEVLRVRLQTLEDQLSRDREDRERERETNQETIADLRKRLDSEQEERRALQRQLMPPAKVVEDAPELKALRKRVEEAEGRMVAAVEALERVQERAGEVAGRETAAKPSRGFLGWLRGR